MNILLNGLIFFPLIAAMMLFLVPRDKQSVFKYAPISVALVQLVASLVLAFAYAPQSGFAFQTRFTWLPFLGIEYHTGVDGLSLSLTLLTTLFVPVALWVAPQKELSFQSLILVMMSGMIGTVLSLNLFQFYIFWELMLIPAFFLIGFWGKSERKIPILSKFFIYTMAGSLILLFSILYLGAQAYQLNKVWTFSLLDLYQLNLHGNLTSHLLFLGFALAFLIKAPLFPFHTWLPDTYCEAPTMVTFLLSGVMAKMGIYGLIRIVFPIFPNSIDFWFPALAGLAVIGTLYGAVVALGQTDLKRLVAYSSMSHMSMILLGVFVWNPTSVTGSMYQVINHAIATGGLFLLLALLEKHHGSTELDSLGGLAKTSPIFAFIFVTFVFSSIGVPGLNGFIGEFMILIGTFTRAQGLAAVAALSLIFSAAYMLRATQKTVFGPASAVAQHEWTLATSHKGILVPFVLAVFVLGVYTSPLTSQLQPVARSVTQNYKKSTQVQTESVSIEMHLRQPHTQGGHL